MGNHLKKIKSFKPFKRSNKLEEGELGFSVNNFKFSKSDNRFKYTSHLVLTGQDTGFLVNRACQEVVFKFDEKTHRLQLLTKIKKSTVKDITSQDSYCYNPTKERYYISSLKFKARSEISQEPFQNIILERLPFNNKESPLNKKNPSAVERPFFVFRQEDSMSTSSATRDGVTCMEICPESGKLYVVKHSQVLLVFSLSTRRLLRRVRVEHGRKRISQILVSSKVGCLFLLTRQGLIFTYDLNGVYRGCLRLTKYIWDEEVRADFRISLSHDHSSLVCVATKMNKAHNEIARLQIEEDVYQADGPSILLFEVNQESGELKYRSVHSELERAGFIELASIHPLSPSEKEKAVGDQLFFVSGVQKFEKKYHLTTCHFRLTKKPKKDKSSDKAIEREENEQNSDLGFENVLVMGRPKRFTEFNLKDYNQNFVRPLAEEKVHLIQTDGERTVWALLDASLIRIKFKEMV